MHTKQTDCDVMQKYAQLVISLSRQTWCTRMQTYYMYVDNDQVNG